MKQENLSYPMNEPYISNGYRNPRKIINGKQINNIVYSYQSQTSLQHSESDAESKLFKPHYSQSTTNLNRQSQQYSFNGKQSQQQNKVSTGVLNTLNNPKRRTNNSGQQQEISTQILHQKIHFLEQQLHQLTKMLQQQSKQSGFSYNEGYEELAIENAQLTIKVQQLEQQKGKLALSNKKLKQDYDSLTQDYQNEHRNNNQLKERMIELQQKISTVEREILKQSFVKESNISNQDNKSYVATLQRQNNRLQQQIQNLLQKMHNLNLEINEEQTSKDEIMQKMNEQLNEIQKLRKQISDIQIQKLQIQEMNNYLKQQINQVNQLGLNKQRQIQDKYIKDEVQKKYKYSDLQSQNQRLNNTVSDLKKQLKEQREQQKQQTSFKDSRISQSGLKSQIKILNNELQQQKQRHQLIRNKLNEMLQIKQNRILELQMDNRKVNIQLRTLRVQNEDKRKQLQSKEYELEQTLQKLNNINSSRVIQSSSFVESQVRLSQQNRKIINDHQKLSEQKQRQQRTYLAQIRNLQGQINKFLQQKEFGERNYITKVKNIEQQIQSTKRQNKKLLQNLEQKQVQIDQKNYLSNELYELQQSHEQLIKEVHIMKQNNKSQVGQLMFQRQSIKQNFNTEINQLRRQIYQKDDTINDMSQKIQNLKLEIQKLSQKQPKNEVYLLQPTACPICPEILKEFNIYKELMQLKFQTMNQMLDQLKMSFTRSQIQTREQISRDKTKYDFWIQQYDHHDKEYNILMERLWQWEKVNAKNQYIRENMPVKNTQINQKSNKPYQPNHLSEIQYDLYLIKLQNSTLRSQISNLQKELSQRDQNPQILKQLQQLKKYSDNLLYQNEQLKSHLNQVVSQKNIKSSNIINPNKRQSIFQRYSNVVSNHLIANNRDQEKALASAELLISKLKKQNDNLIQQRRFLEQQLQKQNLRYRQLIKDMETQRQRTKRQFQPRNIQNKQNYQILDRHNIPLQYIKHHPEHKKLQSEYISLKRLFLQLELQFKKSKQYFEQEMQKMKIQNNFHRERINELQKSQKSTNLFSFNSKFLQQNTTIDNGKHGSQTHSSQSLIYAQNKIKTLEERVIYLESQVQNKINECEMYLCKYEELLKQIAYHPKTSRNQYEQVQRISRLAQNIDVSPIQSPQWQNNEGQHSERQFNKQVKFDEKILQKLKLCMQKKMIQLQITPRQSPNIIIKAVWFIQRLSSDIKELRNNIQILKGQKKSIMKQRNQLKQMLQDTQNTSYNNKNFMKNRINSIQTSEITKTAHFGQGLIENNHNIDQSLNLHQGHNSGQGLNKMKILTGYKSVPRLNLNAQDQTYQNFHIQKSTFNDVINETLELKNQRRTGLKRFQQQVQRLKVQ